MWLPAPIYERLPQFWFVLGLGFVAYGLYIGLDIVTSLGYIAVGLACCFAGIAVAGIRAKHRRDRADHRGTKNSNESLSR